MGLAIYNVIKSHFCKAVALLCDNEFGRFKYLLITFKKD